MHPTRILALVTLAALPACTPFTFAPGAVNVKVTNVAADVAGCTAVGNMRVPENPEGHIDVLRAVSQLKNMTVGLGGNVALVTEGSPKRPFAGIAYKCAQGSGS